jgi:hypothetical protein
MPACVGFAPRSTHFAATSPSKRNSDLELFNYRAEIHDLKLLGASAGGYRTFNQYRF